MAESLDRRNPGWYAGVGAFWLLTAWLITAGLYSIIPQIFRFPGNSVQTSVAGDCEDNLRTLREELLARLGGALAEPGSSREELDAWLLQWDQQLTNTAPLCAGSPSQARGGLSQLRHGLRDALHKVDREQGPRLRKIDQILRDGSP